eukprot:m.83879 g.83879  ORF g.83879 m.83879 type:complete len:170 (+) comp12942_c0_seq7:127-636(+)
MCYLSNKHGWNDVYPTDPQQRAKIDWYLHFHHRNVREASTLVVSKVRPDMQPSEEKIQLSRTLFTMSLHTIENYCLGPKCDNSPFLLGFKEPTLADFAAYVEIGQLQPGFTNVYNLNQFPNINKWLATMKNVKEHDVVHSVLADMGDLSKEVIYDFMNFASTSHALVFL